LEDVGWEATDRIPVTCKRERDLNTPVRPTDIEKKRGRTTESQEGAKKTERSEVREKGGEGEEVANEGEGKNDRNTIVPFSHYEGRQKARRKREVYLRKGLGKGPAPKDKVFRKGRGGNADRL